MRKLNCIACVHRVFRGKQLKNSIERHNMRNIKHYYV